MTGHLPTVVDHYYENGQMVLETLDPREETDLVTGDELQRKGELVTDEQQEVLALHEKM